MKEQQEKQETFDFKQFEEAAIAQLRSGKPLEGKELPQPPNIAANS